MATEGGRREGLKKKKLSWSTWPTPEKLGRRSPGEHPLSFTVILERTAASRGWLKEFAGLSAK